MNIAIALRARPWKGTKCSREDNPITTEKKMKAEKFVFQNYIKK